MIRVEHLTKSYPVKTGRHYVFSDVSVSFPPEANIGIIGPNGGGKSTFLRLLGGIDHPDSGRILSDKSFSWPLGLKGGFINHMSGRDNCRMVCNLYGLGTHKIKRKLEEIKALSGIGRYFEEPVKNYSSGMSGRLGFALSMAFDFDYFLIDEITSVGDAQFKQLAKDALAEKANRSRVIMVSHSMSDIKKFCDIAVLLKDGKITVFEDMDAAIRAYMPKTEEKISDIEAVLSKNTPPSIELKATTLPGNVATHLPELIGQLAKIEEHIATPDAAQPAAPANFHRRLARVYEHLGNPIAALNHFQIASKHDPYDLITLTKLGQAALHLGDCASAEAALAQAEDLDPKHPQTLKLKIRLLQQCGDHAAALEAAETCLRVNPEDDGMWHQRATLLLSLNRPQAALASQMKAVELKPDHPGRLRQLATCLTVEGQIEAAQTALEKARILSLNPAPRDLSNVAKSIQQLAKQLGL